MSEYIPHNNFSIKAYDDKYSSSPDKISGSVLGAPLPTQLSTQPGPGSFEYEKDQGKSLSDRKVGLVPGSFEYTFKKWIISFVALFSNNCAQDLKRSWGLDEGNGILEASTSVNLSSNKLNSDQVYDAEKAQRELLEKLEETLDNMRGYYKGSKQNEKQELRGFLVENIVMQITDVSGVYQNEVEALSAIILADGDKMDSIASLCKAVRADAVEKTSEAAIATETQSDSDIEMLPQDALKRFERRLDIFKISLKHINNIRGSMQPSQRQAISRMQFIRICIFALNAAEKGMNGHEYHAANGGLLIGKPEQRYKRYSRGEKTERTKLASHIFDSSKTQIRHKVKPEKTPKSVQFADVATFRSETEKIIKDSHLGEIQHEMENGDVEYLITEREVGMNFNPKEKPTP